MVGEGYTRTHAHSTQALLLPPTGHINCIQQYILGLLQVVWIQIMWPEGPCRKWARTGSMMAFDPLSIAPSLFHSLPVPLRHPTWVKTKSQHIIMIRRHPAYRLRWTEGHTVSPTIHVLQTEAHHFQALPFSIISQHSGHCQMSHLSLGIKVDVVQTLAHLLFY